MIITFHCLRLHSSGGHCLTKSALGLSDSSAFVITQLRWGNLRNGIAQTKGEGEITYTHTHTCPSLFLPFERNSPTFSLSLPLSLSFERKNFHSHSHFLAPCKIVKHVRLQTHRHTHIPSLSQYYTHSLTHIHTFPLTITQIH